MKNRLYRGWIYVYVNKINGKRYVGQTTNLKRRINEHNRSKEVDRCLLDKAILKYGKENFKVIVLTCFCSTSVKITQAKLNDLEVFWIEQLHTYVNDYPDQGYNLTLGGNQGALGYKHTEESRAKMSVAKKGKHFTNAGSFIKGQEGTWKGKHHSEETKRKLSEIKKAQCNDPEYIEKLKERLKEYWSTHESTCKGIKYSEERKQQMSQMFKGKPNPKNSGSGNGMYGKPAPNRRPVLQFDENWNLIKEWPGAGVAEKELSITNITRSCKNIGKKAGGFLWRYKDEYENEKNIN